MLRFTLHISTSSLNTLYTAESAQFYSAFSPTTPRFRRKREVLLRFSAENTQNDPKTHSYEDSVLPPRFRRQCSAMLRAFGKNGEWSNTSSIWTNLKNIFENVGVLRFVSVSDWKTQKKFKNRLWKSRACVPLSNNVHAVLIETQRMCSGNLRPLQGREMILIKYDWCWWLCCLFILRNSPQCRTRHGSNNARGQAPQCLWLLSTIFRLVGVPHTEDSKLFVVADTAESMSQ
jgi:hypothetical protein